MSNLRSVLRRLLLLMMAIGFTLTLSLPSAAEEFFTDPLATRLKQEGDAAMDALRYEEALQAYGRAAEVEPHPVLHFNRGRALQALHRFPEALDAFLAFRQQAAPELQAKVPTLDNLLQRVRAQVSELQINCKVPGALVLIRGVSVGKAPLAAPVKVNAGTAKIAIVADGYLRYEKDLTLPGAQLTTLDVELTKKLTRGIVRVTSPVSGAVAFVDERRIGTVPAEVAVDAGSHNVIVRHPDYATANTRVQINDGDSRTVNVRLEPKPGILSTWWFWTGVGVLAAGTTATVYALTTERSPGSGDIPPGTISAPLTF